MSSRLRTSRPHDLLPLVLAGACSLSGCDTKGVPRTDSAMLAAEREAVTSLLATRPGWRLAVDADDADTASIRWQRARETDYQPYRRRGDWNRDGISDLAVVLVRDSLFAAYWLPGTPRGFGPPEALFEGHELVVGGLFGGQGELAIGPFESDALWIFRWNSRTQRLELAPDESEDPLPPLR